jgi:hypothetical protein
MAKTAFNRKKIFSPAKLDLNLRKELVKYYIFSIGLYNAEILKLRKLDHKHLESSKMWCWRRMEKISWTDRVRNEEVLLRVKEERNVLHTIKRKKVNRVGHILCKNCLLKQFIQGKTNESKTRKKT